jgi:hypothetical protein
LFIVLSLSALYLFLLGYAASAGVGRQEPSMTGAALAISAGILLNFCLMLTGQPMSRVLVAGGAAAAYGLVRFVSVIRSKWDGKRIDGPIALAAWLAVAALLVAYYVQILSEPLEHWDARSIWFFHARMIWVADGLRSSAGWAHPSIAFSNPDYPKLVPAVAAELAHLKGFWNDYFPKASLLIMLMPVALWVFSLWRARPSFVLLLAAFFFALEAWLWNGYMDGLLVIYAGVALLLIGRYAAERRDVDLYSAICAAGIAANLKNEGLLFAVSFLVAAFLGVGGSFRSRVARFAHRVRSDGLFVRAAILSALPTIMWFVLKKAWHLQSDLTRNPLDGAARFWARFLDGTSALDVFAYLTTEATAIWWLAALVGVAAAVSLRRRIALHPGALIAAAAALLYFAGLYVVYLSTPHDILDFYLSTSAIRTMATVTMSLLVGLFFLIAGLEAAPTRTTEGRLGVHAPPALHRNTVTESGVSAS